MNDNQVINYLKALVIDGVNAANSGHPGGAMSSMDFAYILFTEYLKFDPDDHGWLGRDRFVLSAGHESMLMYSLLHAVGWLDMEELKNFRQLGYKTAGHPEYGQTPGVECTTGPLGQGAAMSVGMAMAALHLMQRFDETAKKDKLSQKYSLFGQNTYALLGDGCMQEDVTLGAASFAGHLKLNNLLWYYDKNNIQISGKIDRSFSDDVEKVFEGFGWAVHCIDAHDHKAIRSALDSFIAEDQKPTLIVGESIMAKGAYSMEGSAKTHGAPLPADEYKKTREALGVSGNGFEFPEEIRSYFQRNFDHLRQKRDLWNNLQSQMLGGEHSQQLFAGLFTQNFSSLDEVPVMQDLAAYREQNLPSRSSFGRILEAYTDSLPGLVGGSADLEPSNMTHWFCAKVGDYSAEHRSGRNFAFGVREFPMSCISNGLALFGGLRPFDATFLSFADYSRPALRLGALQKLPVIHEFTHDSFYLGEDGPTHQPVEHIMSLRSMPNMYVMRPADFKETEVMFRKALTLTGPSSFCLSRQNLEPLDAAGAKEESISRGGYRLVGNDKPDGSDCQIVIFATGSEVSLAVQVATRLMEHMICRVVSLPCWELFEEQDAEYKNSITVPKCLKRVSIEAGATLGWQKFTGCDGLNIGLDHYGESGKAADLAKAFGFVPEAVLERIVMYMER